MASRSEAMASRSEANQVSCSAMEQPFPVVLRCRVPRQRGVFSALSLAFAVLSLQGCSLADMAEISQELLDGDDLIEVMQHLCPNHFMRDDKLGQKLAKALLTSTGQSCEQVTTAVLLAELSGAGSPEAHHVRIKGNNSIRVDLNMTMDTASLLIHGVATRLCEDAGQWSSKPWRQTSVLELERGMRSSLKEATAAGLGAVLPKQDEDYRHIALVCTSAKTARAAVCMKIDEDTEDWIDDQSIADVWTDDPLNDTAAVFASVIAKSVNGRCGETLGFPGDHIVLNMDWNLTGGSSAGWRIAFNKELMHRVMATSQAQLCLRLWPWVQQYQDLLQRNASNGKYMQALREMVLEDRQDQLELLFECAKAGDLEDLGDKALSRRTAKLLKEVFHPKRPDQAASYEHRWTAWGIFMLFTACLCLMAWFGPKVSVVRELPVSEPAAQGLIE